MSDTTQPESRAARSSRRHSPLLVIGNATISPCGRYRYDLGRQWGADEHVLFIGLNPSTADGSFDDPTIRRCMGFARDWGFGGITMVNLFAFRATDPWSMMHHAAPVGPENDHNIRSALDHARLVICAWGAHGGHLNRDNEVLNLIRENSSLQPMCLGTTKDGFPRHPLYLPADSPRIEYHGR